MKSVGLFEAKTRLSEICEQVSKTGEAVTVTRRGKPLVRIDPIPDEVTAMQAAHAPDLGRLDLLQEGHHLDLRIVVVLNTYKFFL